MAQESIFPEIKVVTPKVLCECVGAAVTRVAGMIPPMLPASSDYSLTTHNTGAAAMLDANLRADANEVVN